jgi:flagellar hook-associated protein 1 FlgK
MSLSDALSIALAGIRANQASMSLVSSNVANAETPGYVRKTIDQVTTVTGSYGSGVNVNGVNRELDQYVLAQLRTETSGASYASLKNNYLQQVQGIFGDPNSSGTLENAYSAMTTAVQALATSPDSASARIGVINAAQQVAGQLNSMSDGIQSLRGAAETGISDDVSSANMLLKQIASINTKIQSNPAGGTSTDSSTASLLDQRDQYVTQLSQLMDVRVSTNSANQVSISTSSGVQLVGNNTAATLTFNAQGTVGPSTTYDSNPAKSTLGQIRVNYGDGSSTDLTDSIKSGSIAAYVELRDKTLVQAQKQLDQFAASMSSALSDKTTPGTAAAVTAPQNGFDLDTSGMMTGNVIHISYTDPATNTQHNVSIVRVDDPSVLPLSNTATADPSDTVVGIDFSGRSGSVASQLNAALNGSNLQFSGTSPALQVLNSPPFSNVTSASVTTTTPPGTLAVGDMQMSLFTDTNAAYSGAITANGSQTTGLAQRLTVNAAFVSDPSKLVIYNTSPLTAAGDSKRADFLTQQLATSKYLYSADTGIGSTATPYKGTLLSYMQQFTSAQGAAAQTASQLNDGQSVVLATLQQKFTTTSGVNIDEEMAHLLSLQNAYSANARVMSTVNDLYKTLLQAF